MAPVGSQRSVVGTGLTALFARPAQSEGKQGEADQLG